jgi:hypothetical protein
MYEIAVFPITCKSGTQYKKQNKYIYIQITNVHGTISQRNACEWQPDWLLKEY